MGFTLGDDVVVVPIPDAWGAVVDAELALLDRSSRRATLLNASAALIYTAFDGERPLRVVIDQLVGETGGDRASIAATSRARSPAWSPRESSTSAHRSPTPRRTIPGPALPRTAIPAARETLNRSTRSTSPNTAPGLGAHLTVGGTTCRLRVEDASLAEVVGPLVSSLPEAPAEGLAHVMSLVTLDRADAGRFRLVVDGRVATDDADRDQAIVQLLHELDDLAASEAGEALTFHAGPSLVTVSHPCRRAERQGQEHAHRCPGPARLVLPDRRGHGRAARGPSHPPLSQGAGPGRRLAQAAGIRRQPSTWGQPSRKSSPPVWAGSVPA